jgi:hypothetical protein
VLHQRTFSVLTLTAVVSVGPLAVLACGSAPAPAPVAPALAPAPTTADSASAAPAASSAAPQAAASSAAPAATEAPVLCVDGEILMGACICPSGKGVDATGHCVFMPCPKGNMGGVVFRNDQGQCLECKPGQVRSGDGCISK